MTTMTKSELIQENKHLKKELKRCKDKSSKAAFQNMEKKLKKIIKKLNQTISNRMDEISELKKELKT